MLPACRTSDEPFTIPTFEITPSDVEGFMEELWEFQSAFHDCFARSEPRAHFFDYMVGQCSQLARKSIEPMALQGEGGSIRGLQRGISATVWDEPQMPWNDHQLVAATLGEPDGVLMVDATGFVKKGQDSVGVARQYGGTVGKVANSQVGVLAGQASGQGYARVDQRLFLPEGWWSEAYTARRSRCNVPARLAFQRKPHLAAAMLHAMAQEGILPCKQVVADCVQGNSPALLDAVEACVGIPALVAIASETRCWLQRPQTTEKRYTYTGEVRAKRVLVGTEDAPQSVATVAAPLPASCWYQRTVSEGTKGPMVYEVARQRVTLCKDDFPGRTVWLVVKRSVGAEPVYAYSLSHAPVSTPLRLFVWLSGVRWAIEQCFAESKTALGMAHYEVRKYAGWQPHMMLTMLAHFFLWHLKRRLGKKSAGLDGVPAAEVVGGGVAPAALDHRRGLGGGHVGTATQSSGLLRPPQATTRQRVA